MFVLLIILGVAASLIIIVNIVKYIKNTRRSDSMAWLKQHGKHVTATVKQVTMEQGWKYGNQFNRWNEWEGRYERERVWQTSYYVSAEWNDPETKQSYTFKVAIGSSPQAEKYIPGRLIHVIFNPKHPEQCYGEL